MSEPRWIKLNNGQYTCVDDEDYEWAKQFKWRISGHGYAFRYIKNVGEKTKSIFLHKELVPESDDKPQVDHINHEKLDNRKCNLRRVTHSQNQMNRQDQSNTKHKGLWQDKRTGRWSAHIKVQGKRYLKCGLKTFEDAVAARLELEDKYHGEFKCTGSYNLC